MENSSKIECSENLDESLKVPHRLKMGVSFPLQICGGCGHGNYPAMMNVLVVTSVNDVHKTES